MSTQTLLPPRLSALFKDYAANHKTPGNKRCHYFGVPVITLAVLGLLGDLPLAGGLTGSEYVRVDGGTILLVAALLWYLLLDWKIAIPFGFFGMGLYFVGRAISPPWLIGLFVVGWIVQYIGHYVYEKKSPAFYRSLLHLLVGPLWIFARMVRYI